MILNLFGSRKDSQRFVDWESKKSCEVNCDWTLKLRFPFYTLDLEESAGHVSWQLGCNDAAGAAESSDAENEHM